MPNELWKANQENTALATESKLADLAARVNAEHLQVCGAASTMLEHALEAGRALIEAKKLCLEGAWEAWITAHAEFSLRTAQLYMQLAAKWPKMRGEAQRVAPLSFREAVRMLRKLSAGEESATSQKPSRQRAALPAPDQAPRESTADELPPGDLGEPGWSEADPLARAEWLFEEFHKELRRLCEVEIQDVPRIAYELLDRLRCFRANLMGYRSDLSELSG